MMATPASERQLHERFPPIVSFSVFVAAAERLAEAPPGERDLVWQQFNDHDRSQARAALVALGLLTDSGVLDEVTVRRLADRRHRSAVLRGMLEQHYGRQLRLIAGGVDRPTLESSLAVPARASPSATEKARQFLERAMEAAGMDTSGIRRGRRQRDQPPGSVNTGPAPSRLHALHERFLEQLLRRHATSVGHGNPDPELEALIERELEKLSELP